MLILKMKMMLRKELESFHTMYIIIITFHIMYIKLFDLRGKGTLKWNQKEQIFFTF